MDKNDPKEISRVVYSLEFERFLTRCKKKNNDLFQKAQYQIEKIIREPHIGKPLHYAMKNRRRVHTGSYVLVYEFHDNELRFLDCDHHDKVYKKF